MQLISYDKDSAELRNFDKIDDVLSSIEAEKFNWLNITHLPSAEIVGFICKHFNIHSLWLEDILHLEQRPKMEETEETILFVINELNINELNKQIRKEHISILVGKNFVMTFQQEGEDLFKSISKNILSDKGKLRSKKSDYLLYLQIDTVVDNYFEVIEYLREKIEILEDELIDNKKVNAINEIHSLKKEMNFIHKSLFPLRQAIFDLQNLEHHLIHDSNSVYFNDLADHIEHLITLFDSFREMLTSLIDLNASNISNRMNNVMKTLTVISTIFIPLTFLAGVYGMNFKYMPELESPYAYPILWSIMLIIASTSLIYMKRKKWF